MLVQSALASQGSSSHSLIAGVEAGVGAGVGAAVGAAVHSDGGPFTGQLWGAPNINVAPVNMLELVVADDVSHCPIGWLNAEAW